MAKKKQKRTKKLLLPMAILSAFIASFFVRPKGATASVYTALKAKNYENAGNSFLRGWIGYDPATSNFQIPTFALFLAMAALVHKVVGGGLGVNRVLGQSKIPLLRV